MNTGIGACCQLLRNVTTFQAGDQMKTLAADHPSYLLDGDIGVTSQVGHIAVVVLIREYKTNFQAGLF